MERNAQRKTNTAPLCKEITAMIPQYLSDTLSDKELDRFLHHVQQCRSCYEVLETEFMVDRAIHYLNRDMPFDTSFDMRPLLKEELQERSRTLRITRRIRFLRSCILTVTLVLIALLLLDLTGLFHVTTFFGT